MKINGLHIFLILFTLVFYSCEKPLPTELYPDDIEESGNIEIEVLSSDPDSPLYNDNYDTTGIISPFRKASSIVLYNNIKNTYKARTSNVTTARAYFFEKESPITSHGRMLGYKTKTMGIVAFGNKVARIDWNVIKFRNKGMVRDTITGPYYTLKKWDGFGDDFDYQYSSSVNFRVNAQGNQDYQQEIITPSEINGRVEVTGSGEGISKRYKLLWNGSAEGKIEIIIGGMKKDKKELFPLFSIRVDDSGKLLLPKTLLDKIPVELFDKISFSFIRKIERSYDTKSVVKDIYIASQSIHSIQLDIK